MGGRGKKEKEQKQVLLPLSSGNRKGKHCTRRAGALITPRAPAPDTPFYTEKRKGTTQTFIEDSVFLDLPLWPLSRRTLDESAGHASCKQATGQLFA